MEFDFLREFSSTNRHNIAVLHCKPDDLQKLALEVEHWGIPVLNVGKLVAEKATQLTSTKYLTIELQEFIERTIELQARIIEEDRPQVVAIYNLGILLEPQLGLDAKAILKDASKRNAIIILWENQIDPPAKLHWNLERYKCELDFSDVTQLKVHPYEI